MKVKNRQEILAIIGLQLLFQKTKDRSSRLESKPVRWRARQFSICVQIGIILRDLIINCSTLFLPCFRLRSKCGLGFSVTAGRIHRECSWVMPFTAGGWLPPLRAPSSTYGLLLLEAAQGFQSLSSLHRNFGHFGQQFRIEGWVFQFM